MLRFLVLFTLLHHSVDAFAAKSRKDYIPKEDTLSERTLKETPPPKDNEACFTPDEPCAYKLIQFIQSAQKTLDIAIYDITDKRVANAIIEQAKRVRIRLVLNRSTKDTTGAYKLMKENHLLMRVGKQKGIMHNKFTIVDGKRLELGSYNYSYGAARSNQENQLYLSTPSIIARYNERFEKMWRSGKVR